MRGLIFAVSICLIGRVMAAELDADAVAFFETNVRPILVEHCYECHGADADFPEGGLRLDSRPGWQVGGDSGPAIVPGDVDASLLIDAVRHSENIVSAMPPSSKLSPQQIETLEHWVATGAIDPRDATASALASQGFDWRSRFDSHWSWRPMRHVAVPDSNAFADASSPIDRFVGRRIDELGLRPALPADRRLWLRRVTFDLTGLPPTIEELNAYVADRSPHADQHVVDRLLASPAFGEHWARHWMDLVRYAESHGHEFDFPIQNAFHYRDYLIRAFNADVSYDQLIREHLAGDLIDEPRIDPATQWNESITGTGFWYLFEATHAPTDVQKHEADIIDNQVDVLSKTFLGLTVACARCHDHKFDAISTEDYYALTAYVQSSAKQNFPQDTGGAIARDTATIRQLLADASELVDAAPPSEKESPDPDCFVDFHGSSLPSGWATTGDAFEAIGDAPMVSVAANLAAANTVDSGRCGKRHVGTLRSPTFTITTDQIHVRLNADAGVMARVVIDHFDMVPHNALLFRGTLLQGKEIDTKGGWAWKSFGNDLKKYVGRQAYLEFADEGDGSIAIDRIVFSDGGPPADSPVAPRESTLPAAAIELVSEARRIADRLPRPDWVIAMADGTTEAANVAIRGNPHNVGDPVEGRTLTALGGHDASGIGSRLGLADSIASADNPLTSRVIVNRLWHHLFGRGIVPTTDDFGPQGQPPSDPELLDWLASDFVDHGWSIKRSIRQMVLSQTYRQSASPHPDLDSQQIASVDPTNVTLHRMPVRRLSGESIRDAIFLISGRFDATSFGPSVPTHHTAFMQGRGKRASGPLDGDGRRSVYLSVNRNFLNPFFLTFDTPSPFGPQGRRSRSNVPAQALTMMNDPVVVVEAKRWAETVMDGQYLSDEAKIDRMFVQATGTPPSASQRDGMLRFLRDQSRSYPAGSDSIASDSIATEAWIDLAHAMLNLKAFTFLR
jgi:hypothetical protein